MYCLNNEAGPVVLTCMLIVSLYLYYTIVGSSWLSSPSSFEFQQGALCSVLQQKTDFLIERDAYVWQPGFHQACKRATSAHRPAPHFLSSRTWEFASIMSSLHEWRKGIFYFHFLKISQISREDCFDKRYWRVNNNNNLPSSDVDMFLEIGIESTAIYLSFSW